MLRIAQGRPCPGKELTEEVTPLEAGLWHTVHFDKGCYLGQETIAKVARNRGERQRLWGFVVRAGDPAAVSEGARLVTVGGKGAGGGRAGVVTSVLEQQGRGLAYVRKGAAAVTEVCCVSVPTWPCCRQ
jgi:folate-binding protein YgfZ